MQKATRIQLDQLVRPHDRGRANAARQLYPDHENRIKVIYGSQTRRARLNRDKRIKAFNDPDDPVRVLIATDVASEGLNLQETARYVMHWDIPWNPFAPEQRNGSRPTATSKRDLRLPSRL